MTAPKVIWAFEDFPGEGGNPRAGSWIDEPSECPDGSPRYIRADAPELVALVDAISSAHIPNEQQREAVQVAIAQWEALQ